MGWRSYDGDQHFEVYFAMLCLDWWGRVGGWGGIRVARAIGGGLRRLQRLVD